MNWLALDIGGANVKAADGRGFAASQGFALWRDSERLAWKLRAVIAEAPSCDHLAVTMTGELADCFATKTDGVMAILRAVERAADGRHTRVYLTDGRLVTPQVAARAPLQAASSNWLALATFCGRYSDRKPTLLIDIGSTTTDIVPLVDGRSAATGHADLDRLLAGELVYTGVERSPVCALAATLSWQGQPCPVAQELFATTRDVYLLTGELPEDPEDHHTADHQPATVAAARRRLGRMLSAEEPAYGQAEAVGWAREIAARQERLVLQAACRVRDRMVARPARAILSGHGEFLGRRIAALLECCDTVVSLTERLGSTVSRCAPAHALATLAREAMEA